MRTGTVATTVALVAVGLMAATPTATATGNDGATSATARSVPPTTAALAGGAVTLGEVKGGEGGCVYGSAFGVTSAVEDPSRPSYVAPFSGVLTSYSHFADGNAGSVQALVLRAGADAAHKVVAAKSPKQAVVPSTLTSFAIRLPVRAGERLGIGFSQTGMSCFVATSAADTTVAAAPFDADTTSDFASVGFDLTGGRPNVSAVLEPDVDGDQYGDVSQDLCPQSKLTQAACPAPETTVTKQPKKRSTKRKAKIAFTSVTGATFTCAIDGKVAKPCTSPYKKRCEVRQARRPDHRHQLVRHRRSHPGQGEVQGRAPGLRPPARLAVARLVRRLASMLTDRGATCGPGSSSRSSAPP